MSVALVAVRGLDKTSPAFRRRLVEIAQPRGLNPSYLATAMSFETRGTFSPSIRPLDPQGHPISSAVGLIQFMGDTAALLGTSSAELAAMTAEEQLDYVAKDFDRVLHGRRISSLADHYLAIFAPSAIGRPEDAAVYTLFGTPAAYQANKGLDHNGDGIISVADAAAGVRQLYAEGEKRPPLQVDMNASSSGGGGGAVFAFAAAAAALVWSRSG